MDTEPDIPWERVAAFVRQFTHELRNGLNSLDLETALLQELAADDGETQASAARTRQQVRNLADQLRSLSARFQSPQPMRARIPARELLLGWREQHAGVGGMDIEWVDELDDAEVNVDEAMMATIFRELLSNAATFAPAGQVMVTARRTKNAATFELREPKAQGVDPSDWDRVFFTTRRAGYGLGLWVVRRLVEANEGSITRHFLGKEGALLTTISLPIVKAAEPRSA